MAHPRRLKKRKGKKRTFSNGELRRVESAVDGIEKDEIGGKGSLENGEREDVRLVAVEYGGHGVTLFGDDDFFGVN